MATPEHPHDLPAEVGSGRERLEDRIQVLIMLLIGGAAGAASFRHVHDVAAAHGQPGWLAWADAVVLELASIAAGLELRRNRRRDKSVAFPATVLTVAVFLSLAAQVVEAEASVIGRVAAALPALGFLTMVKIALGRADPAPPDPAPPDRIARPMRAEPGPPLIVDAAVPDTREPVPGPSLPVPATTAAVRDSTTAVPATGDQDPAVPDRRDSDTPVRDRGPEIRTLVPAARTAARTLAAHGTPLSRKALARQLRADGHQLSNATASTLVRLLRAETTPTPAGSVTAGSRVTEPRPAPRVRPNRPHETGVRVCQEARLLTEPDPTWQNTRPARCGGAATARTTVPPTPEQGATSMLTQLSHPHQPYQQGRHRPASRSLSHPRHSGPGVAGRAGLRVDLRSTVRLDPDPRTDPPIPLTAQARPALTSSIPLQTDPQVWGLPPGAAHA